MNNLNAIIVLVILISSTSTLLVNGLNHTICDQDKSYAKVTKVIVNDCEPLVSEPCPFNRGLNATIDLEFTPTQDIDEVKVKVIGKLNALPVVFLVNPDLACGNYGFECPLKANNSYKFKLTLPILRSYPKVNVDVFTRLVDKKGNIISCVEFPVKIGEPVKQAP